MEIRGRIHLIGETTQVTATFKKREIVLLIDGQYPQYPLFEFGQDRCTLLDSFQVGQDVELSFNINGRSSTNAQGQTKYFNSLNAYMIKALGSGGTTAAAYAPPAQSAPAQPATPDQDAIRAAKNNLWGEFRPKAGQLGLTEDAVQKRIGTCGSLSDVNALRTEWDNLANGKKTAEDDDLPF